MKLKNIKASFIFNQNLIENKSGCGKCIFKEGGVTYIIYTHVTGVKSIAQLKTCRAEMEERFHIKIID